MVYPHHSCAASVRARIRTVTFQYNGTGLEALRVTAANPKIYPSPSETPTWAVENMQSRPLSDAQPLWGVLGGSGTQVPASLAANMSIAQQESLRLPGVLTALSGFEGNDYLISRQGQNLPGVDFYVKALQNAFTIASPGSVGYEAYGDYSGMTGLALYSKWQNLSTSPGGAAAIINLVWTDIAANSVVGTKGWGLNNFPTSPDGGLSRKTKRGGTAGDTIVPITVYRRHLRYRILYAIPAIISLGLGLAILVTWLVLLVLGRAGPSKVRWLLDATSPGRMMSVLLWPENANVKGTRDWVKTVGTRVVVPSAAPEGEGVELDRLIEIKPTSW